jgi:hypothetical protein
MRSVIYKTDKADALSLFPPEGEIHITSPCRYREPEFFSIKLDIIKSRR